MMNIPTPWTTTGRATLSRRSMLKGVGASSALAVAPSWLWGQAAPDLVLIMMSDLHSGYGYTASLLQAVKTIISNSPQSNVRIVVNGDVFESGNFLSSADPNNLGAIDFAMIDAFPTLAPTIVTIGNHDGDIFDPEVFAGTLAALNSKHGGNLQLVSDIGDTRTNALYGTATTNFNAIGGYNVKVTSIGTPGNSYRSGTRAFYNVPDPGPYAAATFPGFYTASDFHLALVHAGFQADQAVLPSLTGPFLLQGGHDHLRFTQPLAGGQGLHLHAGYWSNGLAVVGINFSSSGVQMRPRQIQLSRTSPADTTLADQIASARATLLDGTNNPVVGTSSQAYDLDTAVLHAVEVVRQAAQADIGFLSHTTFGDGLPAGPVDRLALNAFIRFPGGFKTGTISGATLLSQILPITNQYGNFPYMQRSGDFLYTTASPANIDPGANYRCVVNSFAASAAYFGAPAPTFVDGTVDPVIAPLELRTLASAALANGSF